ncbi:MAG TPA: Vms1/Ankzf1 family peptidyl-tRNA hydrolase [Actinomycetota bacterium]
MTNLDRDRLRKLADWTSDGLPVSSVYLDVDGHRYPRRQDYVQRAEQLCHQLRAQAQELDRTARSSVEGDAEGVAEFVREFDRGPARGLALFSCSGAGLWEAVEAPRPLKDRATVADQPHLIPLEALVETYESFCTVLVDREKARIFLATMGRIEEESDVFDEVPGRHDQGGWSQSRYQRHIEEHVGRHLKHVADVLLRYFKRRGFDHLILAGPQEVIPEFERHLHDYLARRVATRIALPMTASPADVLARSLAIEEEMEERTERETVDRLLAESAAGRGAVTGLPEVLAALNEGRVQTLVVPFGLESKGVRCSECGRLAQRGSRCRTCGGPLEPIADVVESAVASALRASARVEMVSTAGPESLDGARIGAFLRY